MALNVKIDFKERYELELLSNDMTIGKFMTTLKDGSRLPLGIKIDSEAHPLMPNVYNLAFGPLDSSGQINDQVRLSHASHSRVFSTIVFASLAFLKKYPDRYLGIDGSNNARAYMYYRCIRNNLPYLAREFIIHGVNYYVRILRKKNDADEGFPIDADNIIAMPQPIDAIGNIVCDKLYNYFIFKSI